MMEALVLFDEICNSRWFKNSYMVLFLNKIDIFKEKITKKPIEKYFVDYQGGPNFENGCNYFKKRFLALNKTSKDIYGHFTCATDTQQVQFVMNAVRDMIISSNLEKIGLS
jgi:guanine nucleotide-binding protein G(i) subunit alpha